MKHTIYIIAILLLMAATATAQTQLLNKTWKIKQLNTTWQGASTNIFHKDSASNTVNYSTIEYNFQAGGNYTTTTGNNDTNPGTYAFNATGDSVKIDDFTYALIQINADTFTTRSWTLQLADNAGNTDTAYTYMKLYSMTALPVNLLTFTGRMNSDKVELNWATAQEQNNKEFEILYSASGANFETIGKVTGKGNANSISQYTYNTLRYITGKNYYRLKQIDYDGQATLSRIVTVDVEAKGKPQYSITPNPATDRIALSATQPSATRLQLTLTNVTGKQVWTGYLPAGATTTPIYLNTLRKGAYILAAYNSKGEKVFNDKIVIQ